MRIVHFFGRVRLAQGGTTRAVLDMSRVIAARGHDVTLVTFDDADVPAEWRDGTPPPAGTWPTIERVAPPPIPGGFYPPGGPTPPAAFDGADVLHLHGVWLPWTAQMGARARAAGLPTVLSAHGMLDDWSMRQSTLKKKLYLAAMGRRFFDGVAAFHATADDEKRQAARWVPADRIEVAPLVFDTAPFATLPGPDEANATFHLGPTDDPRRPFTVLFLSRLHYKKQPDVLIRAVAALRKKNINVRLLLAGTGDEPYAAQLRSLATELGLDDTACRFLGMVTGDLKLSVFQAADLFALPTQQENFGLAYTEALACGTPVLSTKGTDIWRELEATGAAAMAEGTPDAFADAIEREIARRDELPEIGRVGRERVFAWLDPDAIGAQYEAMYEKAAKTGTPT